MNDEWYKFFEDGLLKALDSENRFLRRVEGYIKDKDYVEAAFLLTSPLFDENTDSETKEKWSELAIQLTNALIGERDYDTAELIADKFLSIDPYSFDAVELKERLSDRDQLNLEFNLSKVKDIGSSFIKKYYPEESSLFDAIWSTILSLKPNRLKPSPQLLNQLAMVDGEKPGILSTKSYAVSFLLASSFYETIGDVSEEDLISLKSDISKRAAKNKCDKSMVNDLISFLDKY